MAKDVLEDSTSGNEFITLSGAYEDINWDLAKFKPITVLGLKQPIIIINTQAVSCRNRTKVDSIFQICRSITMQALVREQSFDTALQQIRWLDLDSCKFSKNFGAKNLFEIQF